MPDVNAVAALVAAVAAFVTGFGYYVVLGNALAAVRPAAAGPDRLPAWAAGLEFLRGLVLAVVVAGLASAAGVDTWVGGVLLAVALWIGFPLVLWSGAILHERTPWKLAAIHAGDWLPKLVVVAVIVSVWQ